MNDVQICTYSVHYKEHTTVGLKSSVVCTSAYILMYSVYKCAQYGLWVIVHIFCVYDI